jgi:hypothetical protein
MRRVGRYLLNAVTALSLLLCITTLALIVRARTHGLDACTFGHWGYVHHGTYPNYFDAMELQLFNAPDGYSVSLYRHGCIAGPGRFEAYPGEKGMVLDLHPGNGKTFYAWSNNAVTGPGATTHLGVTVARAGDPNRPYVRTMRVPHGLMLALFAALPTGRFLSWIRRRRRKVVGLCHAFPVVPARGATPDRCPECGAIASPSSKPAASISA